MLETRVSEGLEAPNVLETRVSGGSREFGNMPRGWLSADFGVPTLARFNNYNNGKLINLNICYIYNHSEEPK